MRKTDYLKRALSSVLAFTMGLLVYMGAALAQVPSFQNPPFQPSTFMASFTVTPGALTTSDIACIVGSSSRLVKVKSVSVNGIDATAQTSLFSLIKRSAASTGGTATQPTIVPVDSGQTITTPTAVVNAYTAAPTPGTAVGTVFNHYLGMAAATVGAITDEYEWYFHPQDLYSEIRLRGTAQQLCLNNPASYTGAAPTLAVTVLWTEQ